MTVALAPWHIGHESRLTGSIYAVAPELRVDAARALVDAGISVHIDVMAPNEGLPVGITVDELDELAAVVPQDKLGIHLIGSSEAVEAMLPAVPHAGDLYVPIGTRASQSIRLWAAIWDEADEYSAPTVDLDGYDGVLVMLLEPGTSGAADPDRLRIAAAFAGRTAVTVDGGVTEELMSSCHTAGATTMVVGRALLTNSILLTDSTLPEGQS
ncbi:hypothetical protein [Rhodococcoides yunnanense]|uniref:hypothetical protein n=1 Tax=Rhodococcoides yunnanense TaxID=278209 RepID=UPI000933B469|nr:hypothetical protein [Rhodococcus yunnanensis]